MLAPVVLGMKSRKIVNVFSLVINFLLYGRKTFGSICMNIFKIACNAKVYLFI